MYVVIEFQTIVIQTTMTGTRRGGGSKSLRLSDGRHINFLDEKTFKIVATDEIITKV